MEDKELLQRIQSRIQFEADEAFGVKEAIDSDGCDQAEREGLLHALQIVEEEFHNDGRV